MVFGKTEVRIVSHREAGPQTSIGPGDFIVDTQGRRYRQIDKWEAQSIRNSTGGGPIFTLYPNGTIG